MFLWLRSTRASRANDPARTPIDLATVRETLLYMEGDMAGVAGLERVTRALQVALVEIERAGGDRSPSLLQTASHEPPAYAARFVPMLSR